MSSCVPSTCGISCLVLSIWRSTRPEQAALKFFSQAAQDAQIDINAIANVYDQLKPVDTAFLTRGGGEWKGMGVDTGHPAQARSKTIKWAGKTFHNVDDVDPIVVYDDEGKRVWMESRGKAQVSLLFSGY